MFESLSRSGVVGQAFQNKLISLETWNPRDFTHDRHRTVDDRPYGGGPGMVMKVQPLLDAILAAKGKGAKVGENIKVVYTSPQGKPLTHDLVQELASCDGLICVAGRYEGIDERLIESVVDEEISLGDFVLSGGEIASMAIIDSVARFVPGVLGSAESAEQDSFVNGLLDCPHYTRPEQVNELSVPAVLLSGDHQKIRRWRLKQSLGRTWSRRPELLEQRELDAEQRHLLDEFINEVKGR